MTDAAVLSTLGPLLGSTGVEDFVAISNQAARGPQSAQPQRRLSVAEGLFAEPYRFDFFQAVRLLESISPTRRPVGREGSPASEVVRFRALQSLTFPPSSVVALSQPASADQLPVMVVTFLGITGPSGVLPRHYTELLLRLERESSAPERFALRDWLDLFNHRLISLFARASEKYRFYIAYERGEAAKAQPDTFTTALESIIGHATPAIKNRLRVSTWKATGAAQQEHVLARIEHLALLRFAGLLAQRPRCAANLQALLVDYFGVPVTVEQFQGRWLQLDRENQSRLGTRQGNSQLGCDAVLGSSVWDVQGKIRLRIGPLSYAQFLEFLPDRSQQSQRKALFLLSHLVRLFTGQEIDFDVQLVLRHDEVPTCRLAGGATEGPRLGWNTWLTSQQLAKDVADAVFPGQDARWIEFAATGPSNGNATRGRP